MYPRSSRSERPSRPARVPAAVSLMSADDDYSARPFGSSGQQLPARPAAPPPPPAPFTIPPPPWHDQLAAAMPAPEPPREHPSALDAIRAEDDGYDPPPPPGRPIDLGPFIRPTPPPPNWREEEVERALRAHPNTELEPQESMARYPAARRAKQ